jgi:class III poly(R)-hydroxyalkanoic acid synthase PhaE subunit
MDDSGPPKNDWIQQWIEQQRVLLRERSAQQRQEGASEELRNQLQELGTRWLDVGQAYLSGLQQFAGGTQAPGTVPVFKLGEQFLSSWRGHWQSPGQDAAAQADHTGDDHTGDDNTRAETMGAWSDVLRQLPPLGPAREHTVALRELAQTHAECQRLEQALRAMLYGVQNEAMNLVERRVRERPAAHGTLGFRELYDLWVECGEQVYAQVAHSEAYCQLQAQLGNATMQLRARQQKLIEHALKQFDLPTRSELNSVHRQLREQARTLRELQARLEAPQARSHAGQQPAARARSKRKTS